MHGELPKLRKGRPAADAVSRDRSVSSCLLLPASCSIRFLRFHEILPGNMRKVDIRFRRQPPMVQQNDDVGPPGDKRSIAPKLRLKFQRLVKAVWLVKHVREQT